MKTSTLFGIKFAINKKHKAQVIADFKRWRRAKQYFLADERNKKKLFDRILKRYLETHPKDDRYLETIADEVWDKIQVEVAKSNWEKVYEKVLGKDKELPSHQISHHISRAHTKELFRERNAKDGAECQHFYFTESAIEQCEKVNITELDLEWLRDAHDAKRQLNWGDNFIRYEKKDNRIIATAASLTRRQEGKNYLLHTFFVFDLNTPQVQYDYIADIVNEQVEASLKDETKDFERKMQMLLYKMIIFLDIDPLKAITLPKWGCLENEESNEVKTNEDVYNNQNIPFTVVTVDANWNTSIFVKQTTVKNYYKNLKCRGRIVKRLIPQHKRSGHWRHAGKVRYENMKNLSGTNNVVKLQPMMGGMAAGLDVSQKRDTLPIKKEKLLKASNVQPGYEESPNAFLDKLAALKKKYYKTG
jgi:hypothetical protein